MVGQGDHPDSPAGLGLPRESELTNVGPEARSGWRLRKVASRCDTARELDVEQGGTITSVVLWFRARMDEQRWLTNAPEAPRTHWGLAIYDIPEPRSVSGGDRLMLRAKIDTHEGLERTLIELR